MGTLAQPADAVTFAQFVPGVGEELWMRSGVGAHLVRLDPTNETSCLWTFSPPYVFDTPILVFGDFDGDGLSDIFAMADDGLGAWALEPSLP